jgi:Tfp pilus assembly protein PilN
MLKTTLNFSSRPMRNYYAYSVAFRVAFLALAGATALHAVAAVRSYGTRDAARGSLTEIQAREKRAEEELRAAEERLSGQQLAELNRRTAWVNGLIEAHRFSWTALFDDIEHVLPPNVFVQSVLPSVDREGAVTLRLAAVAKTGADLAELLDALEDSPIFSGAIPANEREALVPNMGFVILSDVSVAYLPRGGAAKTADGARANAPPRRAS